MKTVKLIVYGTLMSGERNHRFCRNAVNITPCTVTGTLYDTGYGFPAFVPEGENMVAAELIESPFEDWEAVDRLEGYPRLYDRMMFPAKLEDGTAFCSSVAFSPALTSFRAVQLSRRPAGRTSSPSRPALAKAELPI